MRAFSIILLVIGVASGALAQSYPLGDQFQVNTYIDDLQEDPAIATDGQGNFVVVWLNDNVTPNWVSGQRFLADGNPTGGEFQVNSLVGDELRDPKVAMAGDGRFVVVWCDTGGLDGSGWSIRGQRFAANGLPVGTEMQINEFTDGNQGQPSVAIRDDGSFLVVWMGNGYHATNGIHGRAFDWNGGSIWDQFGINNHIPTGGCSGPDVGIAADGDVVFAWDAYGSPGSDSSGQSVQARCMTWGATTGPPQFQVNSTTGGDQYQSVLAVAHDGSFFVVYYGLATYGLGGQHYYNNCGPAGVEFEVNSPSGFASRPAISVDGLGRYIAVWANSGPWGRLIPATGLPTGESFTLPSHPFTTGWPRVAAAPNGEFIATWHSNGSPGNDQDGYSIQARQFAIFTGIFFDGFESGDTTAWSDTLP